MNCLCSRGQCHDKGKEAVESECSVLTNESKKRSIEQVNSSSLQEIKTKSDVKSDNLSLLFTLAMPCQNKEEMERGQCSVSSNDNKKQRIMNFRLLGKDIEIPQNYSDFNPSTMSVSLSLSIPSSDKNRGTSICVDKSKEISSNSSKDFLTLALRGEDEINWTIKKKLTKSDVDRTQNRLLINKESLKKHIFPYLEQSERDMLSKVGGCVTIIVKDCDRNCEFSLFLKKWCTGSYVVSGGDYKDVKVNNWYKSFVFPKKLKVDDIIGLKFDASSRMLLLGLVTP